MPTAEASCSASTYSISSGQSLRNGNSVEPGLPNTVLMPKARKSSNAACLTVREAGFAGLGGTTAVSFWGVIASRQVRARRGPMTGSAKQSRTGHEALNCFVASLLATTIPQASPRRGALHGGLARFVGGPQLHRRSMVVGIDGKLAAFEQRLQPAVAEFFRRLAAAQPGGHLHDERGLQGSVEDQPGIALDLADIVAVVMDTVAVEGECGIAEQQHRIGDVGFTMLGGRRRWRGPFGCGGPR